jgi:hypothetical protein
MENTTEQQSEKRKRGRPRIHPPKPPKPKLTKEELSKVRREAWKKGQAIREATGRLGGRPKGTSGEGYHRNDNIAVGEQRETITVLKSSADTFRRFAAAKDKTLIAAVKIVTDNLWRNHPEIFAPDAPPPASGVTV